MDKQQIKDRLNFYFDKLFIECEINNRVRDCIHHELSGFLYALIGVGFLPQYVLSVINSDDFDEMTPKALTGAVRDMVNGVLDNQGGQDDD